jgi:transcriptional regulator with XRE-family HTH domain
MSSCLLISLYLLVKLNDYLCAIFTKMVTFKEALYKLLGERIRKIREELDLSQERIAKEIGLGRASISNIEAGKHQIPLSTLYQLSKSFKKEIHMILPTYNEVIEKMNASEIPDIKSVLDKEPLNKKTLSDLENLINNL